MSKQDISDIKYAQKQVRNFAKLQKNTIKDLSTINNKDI